MVKSLLKYDIEEVLLSNEFFSQILNARKIVETSVYYNYEAYFIVYGDEEKFSINKVFYEEPIMEDPEPHESIDSYFEGGGSFEAESTGRWLPDDGHRFIISDLQFKNLNSIGIPSIKDMRRAYCSAFHNQMFFYWSNEYFQTLHFICECRNSKITCLIFQCTDKLIKNFDDVGVVYGINEGFRERYGDGYQALNYDDEGLPFKMEEYLNDGGFFKAKVIRFENWTEYIGEISKLKDFVILSYHAKNIK